ncbi:MAG: hypothetical protein ACE3NC_04100 [Candidatus Wallacebacter cryptica]|jgi:hypothetical protein|nr:hypothetical protein [Bacillota bacterium]
MGIQRCSCCDQYDFYQGRNARIFVESIEDDFDLGLDGTQIFEVLQVGCDCIVVADEDDRRITIDCRKIVAIVGAPGTANENLA